MELLDVFYDGEIIKNACHLTTANFHVEEKINFRGGNFPFSFTTIQLPL